jgi:deoxyribose-phosphate aldolase
MNSIIPELVAEARNARPTEDHARRALACMDLTSLNDSDTDADIETLCARAKTEFGPVAAVCVYDRFIGCARRCLSDSAIRVATVCNFPHGDTNIEAAVRQAAAQVAAGANEVDVVLPYRAYMGDERAQAVRLLREVRRAAGSATLKVILETGELADPDLIRNAGLDAIASGADFIKTSTGKVAVGATLEAAAIMLQVIAATQPGTERTLGFKPAGGISTVQDAASYLHLADAIMGPNWARPRTFRFGASSLLGNVLSMLGGGQQEPGACDY